MIAISSSNALIGINTSRPRLSIEQPKADFELHSEQPRLEIHTEQGQIIIDQRQCFNESGLKDMQTLIEDAKQEARQALIEGIAKTVSEGKRMAACENKNDAFAEIARNNSYEQHVFGIVTMPKSRPKIDFIGGTVDIQVKEGYVELRAYPRNPIIDAELGKVDIFLRQKPSIQIEHVGNNVNVEI